MLRFALGLFSTLAFLEAEEWPWKPRAHDWALDRQGLPVLLRPPAGDPDARPVAEHAAFMQLILSGKRPAGPPPWPSVSRRHRHFALWNGWLASAGSRSPEEGSGTPARDLLQELWRLAEQAQIRPSLPSAWGIGVFWSPASGGWPAGWQEVSGASIRTLEASLALGLHPIGQPPLLPIFLGDPPPYPYAALEPLVTAATGDPHSAREWMRARTGGTEEALQKDLTDLLGSDRAPGGWFLWPADVLDTCSRQALRWAAAGLDRPCVLAAEGPGAAAGAPQRVHLVWLPKTAEDWYLQHAGALLGPSRDGLLKALEGADADTPKCGTPLVPPLGDGAFTPFRPLLGTPHSDAAPEPGRPKAQGRRASPSSAARRGELAALLSMARGLRTAGNRSEGLFWEGVFFLLMGQPGLALHSWRDLGSEGGSSGRLAVFRARAHERFLDYESADRFLKEASRTDLDDETRNLFELAKGQLLWIQGKPEDAEERLASLCRRAEDPDVVVQALCHRATVALDANRIHLALERLREAIEAAPRNPEPFTSLLLAHRQAKAFRKMGQFDRALAGFQAAGEIAARHGFRGYEAACASECGDTFGALCCPSEAMACYRKASEGASALGLSMLEESARTGFAVCQIEAGELVGARAYFSASLERDSRGQNALYRATDFYWLAVVSQQLGDLPAALEHAEAGLAAMKRHEDPELRLPLLALRGECLLLTGQARKLALLLRELGNAIRPDSEPGVRLSALALRCASARKGTGQFSLADREEALALLPACSAPLRAYWHLLPDETAGCDQAASLRKAWEEAYDARQPFLSCRALLALARRNELPLLSPEVKDWLGGFLTRNSVRGHLRDLLPYLAEDRLPASRHPRDLPADLALLSSAESPDEQVYESLVTRLRCEGACLIRSGRPPGFWGRCSPGTRKVLLETAGLEGTVSVPGGVLLGCRGRDGAWSGFFRAGKERFDETEACLAKLWAKLIVHREETAEPEPAVPIHPALSRHLLTQSPAMQRVIEEIVRAAPFLFPVLFTGEPGVGKEACAKALHAVSPRGKKPWVPFNCANLSPTLATSQLFGHKRGSFTGADRDQAGLAEAARGSTLFLDEVGELPPEVQPNLLRFLQDGTYLPLGEVRPRESDARIVAATNRNLEQGVSEGRFREDLFHRLNVIRIEIPPLRERPEDVPVLFDLFLGAAARDQGFEPPDVDPGVPARLSAYGWPGNVRELQNVAKRLLVAAHREGRIREQHLPERLLKPAPKEGAGTLAARLRETERSAIREALSTCGGNAAAAARSLGITRQGLFAKMRRLGLK